MPAILSLSFAAATPIRSALTAVGRTVVRGLTQLRHVLKNRRDAAMLASFDDRMLADIGITRSDLRDAYAEPLWHDPTDVLASRAAERRVSRRRSVFEQSASAPKLGPSERDDRCYPRLDRPAQYLM